MRRGSPDVGECRRKVHDKSPAEERRAAKCCHFWVLGIKLCGDKGRLEGAFMVDGEYGLKMAFVVGVGDL